ncbi:MAG: glycosyltransferase [Labilithrix sp.]
MRLLFVITAMGRGGAEIQAKGLAARLVARGHKVMVVVLLPIEEFEDELNAAGVETRSLGMRRGVPSARAAVEFVQILRRWRPDVVQTWMYAADLLGGFGSLVTGTPVAWGIRCSRIHSSRKSTLRLMRLSARVSGRIPRRIFANSEAGRQYHVAHGYSAEKMRVVPNGFDIERYRPDQVSRDAVRTELGIQPGDLVVGIVARFDPLKDHATFFRAAGILVRSLPEARFLVVGRGLADNPHVARWVADAGIRERCIFTGQRGDTERLANAMDVATLTSCAEGFPNALGEAMACGVPCVATNAGDSVEIIGDASRIVPVGDAAGLARRWEAVLRSSREERSRLGALARERIVERFSVEAVTSRYEREWEALARRS